MIKRDESGYSMVEVLVAILILVIAIVPMFAMFDLGLRTATTNSNYDEARALAEKQVELAQSVPYESVQSEYPLCGSAPVSTPSTPDEEIPCEDEDYSSLQYSVKKTYLGFEENEDASKIKLCTLPADTCEEPSGGSGMIQVTIEVFRQDSPGDLIFTTTGVVTE